MALRCPVRPSFGHLRNFSDGFLASFAEEDPYYEPGNRPQSAGSPGSLASLTHPPSNPSALREEGIVLTLVVLAEGGLVCRAAVGCVRHTGAGEHHHGSYATPNANVRKVAIPASNYNA